MRLVDWSHNNTHCYQCWAGFLYNANYKKNKSDVSKLTKHHVK